MTEVKLRQSGNSEQQQASAHTGPSTQRAEPAGSTQNGTAHQQSGSRAAGAGPQGLNGAGLKHRHPHGREEPVPDPVSALVEENANGLQQKQGELAACGFVPRFSVVNDRLPMWVSYNRGHQRSASWWHRFSRLRWVPGDYANAAGSGCVHTALHAGTPNQLRTAARYTGWQPGCAAMRRCCCAVQQRAAQQEIQQEGQQRPCVHTRCYHSTGARGTGCDSCQQATPLESFHSSPAQPNYQAF
jgi:hypothetical protein